MCLKSTRGAAAPSCTEKTAMRPGCVGALSMRHCVQWATEYTAEHELSSCSCLAIEVCNWQAR